MTRAWLAGVSAVLVACGSSPAPAPAPAPTVAAAVAEAPDAPAAEEPSIQPLPPIPTRATTPTTPDPTIIAHCPHHKRPPRKAGKVVLASLARSPGMNFGAGYSIVVYRDGTLQFDGWDSVRTCGEAIAQLDSDQLLKLEALFLAADFTSLGAQYGGDGPTDMDTATTTFQPMHGAEHTVWHYEGGTAPGALEFVEDQFDEIVNSEQFTGTQPPRVRP